LYYWIYFYIFLFLHITKASPRLTPYRLKGKKGVGRLRTSYRLKNYGRVNLRFSGFTGRHVLRGCICHPEW
jgi:hypothetical protein